MMGFSFRVPIELVSGGIDTDLAELDLASDGIWRVWLQAAASGAFKSGGRVGLRGSGFIDQATASSYGERWINVVALGLLRSGIEADLLSRVPFAKWTDTYLAQLSSTTPDGVRVVADRPGVTVHRDDEQLLYSGGSASARTMTTLENVRAQVGRAERDAMERPEAVLAYDIFSTRSRLQSIDAQFLTLVMALEVLIQPMPLSTNEQKAVDEARRTVAETDLTAESAKALDDRLRQLKRESIGAAGRRLARTLGERRFMDRTPEAFFTYCYGLRSKLSHGATRPPLEDVHMAAAHLITFVRELIERQFTDARP